MKRFDSTKQKYSHLFQVAILLINFLHGKRMDLTYKIIGDQNVNPIASSMMTPRYLTIFKLLIFTLFNL